MFGTSRTVIFMADEAVVVYAFTAGRFSVIDTVGWHNSDFDLRLTNALTKGGRGHAVVVLYDMVEQYYRKEVVPKVTFFDQKGILERKLKAAFQNYPIRAALPMKMPAVRKGTESRQAALDGKLYLFAAIPGSEFLHRISEVVRRAMVQVAGVWLLPVESVSLVEMLDSKLNQKKKNPGQSSWIVLLGQHHGGGLRQIVVKNGELALTRLTPIVDTAIEPHMWASEVEQEFVATLGYLSRFGYTADDSLDIIVIGDRQAVDLLGDKIKVPCTYYALTVEEAARLIGVSVRTTGEESRYADLIHAAWASRRMMPVVSVTPRDMKLVSQARRMAAVAATVLTFSLLGSVGYVGTEVLGLLDQMSSYEDSQGQLAREKQNLSEAEARLNAYGVNVKLVQSSINMVEGLEAKQIDLITFLQGIAGGLTPELRFDEIQMGYVEEEKTSDDPMSVEVQKKQHFQATLKISFSESVRPEVSNKVLGELRDRIAKGLPKFEVSVSRPVQDLTLNADFEYEAGTSAGKDNGNGMPERLPAELTIRQRYDDQNSGT